MSARGAKTKLTDSQWRSLLLHPTVPYENIMLKEIVTIQRLKRVINTHKYIRIGTAWSGGKDSIVLQHIIEKAGIHIVKNIFVQYINEYPDFIRWVKNNLPADTIISEPVGFSFKYLNDNPDYLFPLRENTKIAASYYPQRWKVQNDFSKQYSLDLLITGRRIDDGNFCGSSKDEYITKSKNTVSKFNLIADWTQAEIMAYIKYNDLELPPIYNYPNGFAHGTQPWTKRERVKDSIYETFKEIEGFDRTIIEDAVKGGLTEAIKYKEEKPL